MSKQAMDYSKMTDHEVHIVVRKALDSLGLRQRLYPAFIRKTNSCESREDLLLMVKTTLEKAKDLTQRKDNLYVNTNSHSFSKEESNNNNNRTSRSTPSSKESLYVKRVFTLTESLQEKVNKTDLNDAVFFKTIAKLSPHIKAGVLEVLETLQVFSVTKACNECRTAKIPMTKPTMSSLLEDLYFMELVTRAKYRTSKKMNALVYTTLDCPERKEQLYVDKYEEKLANVKNNFTLNDKQRKEQLYVKQDISLDDLTDEQLARSKKAKEAREKNKKPISHDKVIDIKYTCQSCRIKRYQDKDLEKHKCPECKNEMTPILDGDVRVEGAVTYLKEFDKR